MAAYLIQPHRMRLDFDDAWSEAIAYAVVNQLHIQLWPAGYIVPKHFELKYDWYENGSDAAGYPTYALRDKWMEVEW